MSGFFIILQMINPYTKYLLSMKGTILK